MCCQVIFPGFVQIFLKPQVNVFPNVMLKQGAFLICFFWEEASLSGEKVGSAAGDRPRVGRAGMI